MSEPVFIYLHGFNSSPHSWKARCLRMEFVRRGRPGQLRVPALSHWPAVAIEQAEAEIAAANGPVTLIGSSLGGYYSTWLVEHNPALRAVLINPAVYPHRLLRQWLGQNSNLHSGAPYQLTERHLEQLLALQCAQLRDPSRYLLLVQTGDATLDYREAVARYAGAAHFVQPGGSHGFDQFAALIPAIRAFAEGSVALPEPVALPLTPP